MSQTDLALAERARQYQQTGRLAEAEALWRHLAATNPDNAAVHFNLGTVLAERNQFQDAAAQFEKAVAQAPNMPEAFANLGVVRQRLGQLDEAVACYRQALALKPDLLALRNNLAGALQELGLADEAFALYRDLAARCDDPTMAANLLTSMNLVPGSPAEALAAALRWAARFAEPAPPRPIRHRRPGERLRVGYVGGPGLRRHTLALTWLPLIESHDPGRIEVFAYSDLAENREDDVSQRFRNVAHWRRSAGLDADALADLIRGDGIHILVDGIGFAAGSRLLAFARRPAPVQVHFPPMGTTGMTAMDYIVADRILIEEKADRYFQERVWRLPCGFLYSPTEPLPDVSAPPSRQSGTVTFGSFNRFAKIGPLVIAAWARILTATPHSRLLIKSASAISPSMVQRYASLFAGHGIGVERLEFRGRTASDQEHYRMLADMDIALDPFPHGGVLTICDALALGVPVVTLAGSRPLERYGAAILNAAGFAEGITASVDDYIARAVAMAQDLPGLGRLRSSLSRQMAASPLVDAPRFARTLEDAYEAMWHEQVVTQAER